MERDTARTRRAVLDATARMVATQGAGVSLDAIARQAGVSKSGLLHHFRTRDQLLLALARDLNEQFTAAVQGAVEPGDHARGRLVRGYVRATFAELATAGAVPEHIVLAAALATVPGVAEIMQADARRWNEAFAADGLHPDRVLLIVKAADGAALATLYEGEVNLEQLRRTRELLLALSRDDGPVHGAAPADRPAETPRSA